MALSPQMDGGYFLEYYSVAIVAAAVAVNCDCVVAVAFVAVA